MTFVSIKDTHLRLLKRGKIGLHKSVSRGKSYARGKVYLKDAGDVGSTYRLYRVDNLHLVSERKQHRKGRAYIIFIG